METPNSLPILPQHGFKKISFAIAGIFIPPFCFWFGDAMKPEWQGDGNAFAKLFFMPEVNFIFYPLLAYSILCLALLFWSEEETAPIFWTRLGIYGGFLLALFFIGATFPDMAMIIGIGGVPSLLLWLALAYGMEQSGENWKRNLGIFVVGFLALLAFVPQIGGIGIFALLFDPFWCVCIYGWLSFRLFVSYEMHRNEWLIRTIGTLGWSAGFGMAWRISYLKALEEYQKLPQEPLDCYIATAASQGHSSIVQSKQTILLNGKPLQVNLQLQRFKAVEIALKTQFPQFHFGLRKVYDYFGKALAQGIKTPIMADMAYLLLKPFEWVSYGILILFIPQIQQLTSKLYQGKQRQDDEKS